MVNTLFKESDYLVEDGLIQRICKFEVGPKDKNSLLESALGFFTGENEVPKLTDFKFCQEVDEEIPEADCCNNCICSQKIHNLHYITHIPSDTKFKIGRNCFENLYGKVKCDELNFFKPLCLNCKKVKVLNRRTNAGKEQCCSDKCMYIYRRKVPCIDCNEKFWRMDASHKLCKKCFFKSFYGYRNPKNINI